MAFTLTVEQLEIMFLMTLGQWDRPPLSRITGCYLGYDLAIDRDRWTALRQMTAAAEMARLALTRTR